MSIKSFMPVGKDRFVAIKQHYVATGLTTRQHGNTKRTPKNTLTYRETQNALKFLRSYAEANAILLPGRIPGYMRDDLQLLPSTTTKMVSTVNLPLNKAWRGVTTPVMHPM